MKAWVVESERGRTVELEKWDPTAPFTGTAPVESAKLNAATGGDLVWAAVYDNVRDRFAFHDDLADLGTGRPVLSYVVVGWYSQPSLDPLAPPTVPAGMRDAPRRPRLGRRPQLVGPRRGLVRRRARSDRTARAAGRASRSPRSPERVAPSRPRR